MAKYVLKDAYVSVNSVDLSDHVSSVTIETTRDEVDVTAMGNDYKEILFGISDATATVAFFQDHAAGEVDATLFPLSTSDTPFPLAIRPNSGAISATNPEFQMSVLMANYSPIAGDVGSASTTDVTFRNAAQTGLVRDVTP
jgi:hypothetical protein